MKRVWDTEELIEHWTLLPPELELLGNKTGSTRLGFALLLKFFQHEARFPKDAGDISEMIISYVAKQVGASPEHYSQYNWHGRAIKYHRAQIRQLHKFREATVEDAKSLTEWLSADVLPRERDYERLKIALYRRCRELHIEPPTPERIERVVRKAVRTYEERFCADILSQLSSETQIRLDALLQSAVEEASDEGDIKTDAARAVWHRLKADPGRASTDTMLEEITKLEQLRALNLPPA